MATFVLVHGASARRVVLKRVAELLTAKDHTVFAPTLTGLCERSHLLNPNIDLDTHILDIVNEMKWKELRDVILVGHSYGGMVISGVVEKMEKSIAALVMLDTFLPANGQSYFDIDPYKERIRAAADEGLTAMPPLPAEMFGVNEKDRAWVSAQLTPHPIKCFLGPVALTGARDRIPKRCISVQRNIQMPALMRGCPKPANKAGTHEVPSGHDVMIDAPTQLAEILDRLA